MSEEVNKNLASIFNLPQDPPKELTIVQAQDPTKRDLVEEDFLLARNNIHAAIRRTREVMDNAVDVANAGEDAESFQAANQLLRTMIDANRQLMALHKQIKGLEEVKANPIATTTNKQTNVFVGTTRDLLELLKNKTPIIDQ